MRFATMTTQQFEQYKAQLAGLVDEALLSLGMALMNQSGHEASTRNALAIARQQLDDADARLRARRYLDEQADAEKQSRRNWPPQKPRVTIDQVKAEQKRFTEDYDRMKRTPAEMERGKALLAMAKISGQIAVDDTKRFLLSFGGSPELRKLW